MGDLRKQKRVLLVDDETAFLLGFKRALECTEIRIDIAETAEDSLNLFKSRSYDYVISDIRLTGVMLEEGLDILRYVKKSSPETKVIIITGYGNPDIKEKAYALGADLYFEKPVSTSMLRRAITRC